MRQILVNLIGNAVKFTDHGEVVVRVGHQKILVPKLYISFEVSDTGVGIAPEMMDRISKPFEQADTSSSRRFMGTGLGLAISRQLIEMMGGELSVESALGQGSIFRFTLCLEPADHQTAEPEPIIIVDDSPNLDATVLLVEDNPVNQAVAQEYLMAMGCHVDIAASGLEAIAACERKAYDLILMDCEMPVMDGFEATEALRQMEFAEKRQRLTPIIALTARAMKGDRERCIAVGMNDYLSKPLDPDEFETTLRRWILEERPQGRDTGDSAA